MESFSSGSNLRKAQFTIRNVIQNEGSIHKEQGSVRIDSNLQWNYRERMLSVASRVYVIDKIKS